jgi:nitrate reductase gamma subunit
LEGISILHIVTYLLILATIIAFATRLARYANMPTHLRWELYPLVGETKRPWGGSYLEESEWWNKPREEKSLFAETKFIVVEILSFREYFRLNRPYWYLIYPFHLGVFLFVTFLVMLLVGAITTAAGATVSAASTNVWGQIVYYLTLVTGGAGLILGLLGTIGVLIKRMVDNKLKPYTRRIEYLHLLFVLAIFATGFFSWILTDTTFAIAREYVRSLFTFSSNVSIAPLMGVHIVLLLLLAAYMPFTNMMHFFAKTFTFHSVRWDDLPNLRGGKLEKVLGPLVNQPVSWSAPHIHGINRWSDTAQEAVAQEVVAEPAPRIRKGVN